MPRSLSDQLRLQKISRFVILNELQKPLRLRVVNTVENMNGRMTMTDEMPPVIETDARAKQWAMLCHLIALVGLLGNGIGFLLGPLIVWLIKKDEHPYIDEQGKEALNFQLTMLLAAIVSIPLVFVGIGIVTLIAIAILSVVFPIIAGINASNGNPYRYPLTIRFVK